MDKCDLVQFHLMMNLCIFISANTYFYTIETLLYIHFLVRLWLHYGGRDITRCFYWLLKKVVLRNLLALHSYLSSLDVLFSYRLTFHTSSVT
jgi:hypothetical protein